MKKNKISHLDKFLEKHKTTCSVRGGDGRCSCGRDAAVGELSELRTAIAQLHFSEKIKAAQYLQGMLSAEDEKKRAVDFAKMESRGFTGGWG